MEKDLPESKLSPSHIHEAINLFKNSFLIAKILGEENLKKSIAFKQAAAGRCSKDLGKCVKNPEVLFHHKVTSSTSEWL